MPPDSSHAPVFPVRPGCPLWLLVEWAEVFRAGLRSRTKIVLEAPAGAEQERWLVLVRYRPGGAPLAHSLPRSLRVDCAELRGAGLDRLTVARVFRRMKTRAQTVGAITLRRWGGAAVFIRLPADDARIARLTALNARARRPRAWFLPASRAYPASLRKAYACRLRRRGAALTPAAGHSTSTAAQCGASAT